MCDEQVNPWAEGDAGVSRRAFSLGAAAAAGLTATQAAAAPAVVEKDVEIKTPDGVSDSAIFHPAGRGTWPGVLIWPDIGGLRPVMREMGRRLAAQGYVVLVVNPFYRTARATVTANYSFGTPEGRQALMGARQSLIAGEGPFRDAHAYVAFLDAQPQTNRKKPIGVQGYCMGGPLSFQTAGAEPSRIGAVATFHGGGLTTKEPSSPHLLVARTKASYLVAVARDDDARDPQSKEILKKTFADTHRPATVEVYPADHGWCVPGSQVYDHASAERAWSALTELYRKALG